MRTGETHLEARAVTEAGYAMVALLVGLNVMAVMMTVALPVWRQMAQREREAELIFRGEQYKRAISLYERRNGPGALPPDIDSLIDGRFLRREYKDPMTGEDFVFIRQGQSVATSDGGAQPRGNRADGGGSSVGAAPGSGARPGGGAGSGALGGIVGVVSSSQADSLRIYDGQTRYDQWLFVHASGQDAGDGAGDGPGGRGQGDEGDNNGRGRGRRGQPDATGRGGQGSRGIPDRPQDLRGTAPQDGRGPARGRALPRF